MNAIVKPRVAEDWAWQAPYMPTIRAIIGPYLLQEAPPDLDLNEATDLMILAARDLRIGVRLRRAGFAEDYPHDFTVRWTRSSGAKTEWRKIIDGYGDWMFYGHAAAGEAVAISRWMLIDLAAFRAHHVLYKETMRDEFRLVIDSGDGTKFAIYDWRKFAPDPPILIAASFELSSE